MAVVEPDNELLEEPPSGRLLQPPSLLHVLKQGAAASVFHGNADVVVCEEDLSELDDMGMPQDSMVKDLCFNVLCNLFSTL